MVETQESEVRISQHCSALSGRPACRIAHIEPTAAASSANLCHEVAATALKYLSMFLSDEYQQPLLPTHCAVMPSLFHILIIHI